MSNFTRDLFGKTARDYRDEGISKVISHNEEWKAVAEAYVRSLKAGKEITGEDIRIDLESVGVKPDHFNAWGGFISGLVRKGILVKTGNYRQMKRPQSHARVNPVYYRGW